MVAYYKYKVGISGNYTPVLGCEPVDEGCRFCTYLKSLGVKHPAEHDGVELKKKGAWTGNVVYRGGTTHGSYGYCKMVGTDVFQPKVSDAKISLILNNCMTYSGYYAICTKYINRGVYYFIKSAGNGMYIGAGILLGTSVPTQSEVWRIGALKKAPVRKLVMFAPLLENIGPVDLGDIEQVIANGEVARGDSAREAKVGWIDNIYQLCLSQGVRFTCDDLGTSIRIQHGIESDEDEEKFKSSRWPKSKTVW